MGPEDRQLLAELVNRRRLMALGIVLRGRPYVGQVPYALWAERGSLLIHVSALARHTRGLGEGAEVSVLVSGGEPESGDPFQVPRVTFDALAHPVERSASDFEEASRVYLDQLPSGARHFQLGDFTLFELQVTGGRFVAGFGRTYNLTASHLREL